MRDCLLAAASRELAFFWQQKKARKENCRCFDAADPRLGGCTPPRPPKRKSEGAWAKRKQYYFSFLTPPPLPPLLSRCSPEPPLPETAVRRGRACPARSLASAPGFVLHPLYLLHRREGLRGCEQGPRLSGAKPGCEQCLPLRGKQPHERVCEANWRRSLCAAKR